MVERFRFLKIFESQMHPVTPVISWIGGNVDALGGRIVAAQLFIHAEQILQLKNAPHGRGIQVLANDGPVDARFASQRSVARLSQSTVVKILAECGVLLPPAANRAHVMR